MTTAELVEWIKKAMRSGESGMLRALRSCEPEGASEDDVQIALLLGKYHSVDVGLMKGKEGK